MQKQIGLSVFLVLLVFIIGGAAYFYYLSSVSIEKMKYCETAADCVPVECTCKCSGGGFTYDDIINKKYKKAWYLQHNCSGVRVCPEVLCTSGGEIICEQNQCGIIDKKSKK